MAKVMTFDEYIINPLGKSNAILSNYVRESIRRGYQEKWNSIMLRENGKVTYKMWKDTKHNTFYILLKIPSETVTNFYYDVVIKFFTDEEVKEGGHNLSNYSAQYFSNDPAFIFTYAHTFINHNMFVKELTGKLNQNVIKDKAEIKNPSNQNGYIKSLYFAYLFMKERRLFSRVFFDAADEYKPEVLTAMVMDSDKKITLRQEEGKKLERKSIEKQERREVKSIGNTPTPIVKPPKIGKINTILPLNAKKHTSKVNYIKKK